jgi:hypothetical protein
MKDQYKTKQLLIQELVSLRQRIAGLEQSESGRKRTKEGEPGHSVLLFAAQTYSKR